LEKSQAERGSQAAPGSRKHIGAGGGFFAGVSRSGFSSLGIPML